MEENQNQAHCQDEVANILFPPKSAQRSHLLYYNSVLPCLIPHQKVHIGFRRLILLVELPALANPHNQSSRGKSVVLQQNLTEKICLGEWNFYFLKVIYSKETRYRRSFNFAPQIQSLRSDIGNKLTLLATFVVSKVCFFIDTLINANRLAPLSIISTITFTFVSVSISGGQGIFIQAFLS